VSDQSLDGEVVVAHAIGAVRRGRAAAGVAPGNRRAARP
jgi:hypothetical protein